MAAKSRQREFRGRLFVCTDFKNEKSDWHKPVASLVTIMIYREPPNRFELLTYALRKHRSAS